MSVDRMRWMSSRQRRPNTIVWPFYR